MFYLMMHSTHFIYAYMALEISIRKLWVLKKKLINIFSLQFCRSPSSFTTVDNGSQPNGYQSSRIEYQFPWGPETVETVTNEGDTPLQEKEKETKISLRVSSICRFLDLPEVSWPFFLF